MRHGWEVETVTEWQWVTAPLRPLERCVVTGITIGILTLLALGFLSVGSVLVVDPSSPGSPGVPTMACDRP